MLVPALMSISPEFLSEKFVLDFIVHWTKYSTPFFVIKTSDMNRKCIFKMYINIHAHYTGSV